MNNEIDDVFALDDTPPQKGIVFTQNEVDQITEEVWSVVKNNLQDFLWRAENAENPAFTNQTIFMWIDQYAEQFDKFYREKRSTMPEQLLVWWEESKNSDTADAPEFIREWVAFRERADSQELESAAT